MEFKYNNKEKPLTEDFLNEINKEFLSFVSKNRGFIYESKNKVTPIHGKYISHINFEIEYYTIKDDKEVHYFCEYALINLDRGILFKYGDFIDYPEFHDIWPKVIWFTNLQYDENYEFGIYNSRDELKIDYISKIIPVS